MIAKDTNHRLGNTQGKFVHVYRDVHTITSRYSVLLLSFIVLCLPGCQLLPSSATVSEGSNDTVPVATQRSAVVARDLVSALAQIPASGPSSYVYVIQQPRNDFGRVVARELQRAGYDLRLGNATQTQQQIAYSINAIPGDGARSDYEFTLSAGDIAVKRRYGLEDDRVFPVSSMLVSGADTSSMVIDDSLFDEPTSNRVQLAAVEPPAAIKLTPVAPKENMYNTRRSNFADATAGYKDLSQNILVFPNDSLMLGRNNKQLLRDIMSEFDEQTDVVSVIGCSHGKTNLSDGNRRLALGRAARVRDELTAMGVAESLILDEGCWANVHFDEMMPRRGVVLTIKRIKPSAQSPDAFG